MGWKTVKRPKPQLDVPLGVAWDAEGQPMIPHHDLVMPDGRRLEYDGPVHTPGYVDSASYHTRDGLRVAATISAEYGELGPMLQAALLYLRRDPSWAEITGIKHLFFGPDVAAMMLLPGEQHFVHGHEDNQDSHVFHIWQMPATWEQHIWPAR